VFVNAWEKLGQSFLARASANGVVILMHFKPILPLLVATSFLQYLSFLSSHSAHIVFSFVF